MLGADLLGERGTDRPLDLTRGQLKVSKIRWESLRHPHCPTANVNISTRRRVDLAPAHAFGAVSKKVKSKRFASLLPATHCSRKDVYLSRLCSRTR
jgi:hypothetical protein